MTDKVSETLELTLTEALDRGCEFARSSDHRSAVGLFRGVLMHEAENFEAMQRLGVSLFELKHYHEALYWFWRGKKISPKHPMALSNYGLCLAQLGHWDEGLADLERAVHRVQKHPVPPELMAQLYNNLGNTLEKLKRYPEALVALDKGLSYREDDQFAHYNRGIVLLRLNRHQEALAALNRALELNPGDPDASYNRAMGRLLTGDLKNGFADYEARLLTSENEKPNFGLPASHKWTGDNLGQRTILVHGEQGLGDSLQFLRFLRVLRQRYPDATIRLYVHSALREWVSTIPGITVLPKGSTLTARTEPAQDGYDVWAALMSLPLLLGLDEEAKLPAPYLPPLDQTRVEKWRGLLDKPGLKVGVCWAGNWLHKNDAHRSIPLKQFARLFNTQGCTFVSLQQLRQQDFGPFAELQAERKNLLAAKFSDFRDTAAAMLALDVVVTVDTAVAHLAASLGVPTLILIPAFATDWRWQLKRTDSPWYPSASLYRQPDVGDWNSVLDRLTGDLTAMAAQRAAA